MPFLMEMPKQSNAVFEVLNLEEIEALKVETENVVESHSVGPNKQASITIKMKSGCEYVYSRMVTADAEAFLKQFKQLTQIRGF